MIFLLGASLLAFTSKAQELPQPSPLGKTEQMVGLTSMSVEYSRPSVKARTIFGELVPYDKVWRLGANACTKLTISTDAKIGGQEVKAGTYSMFATPSKDGKWKIAFNSDIEQGGTGSYDTKKDVAVYDVKSSLNTFNETLIIEFNNVTSSSCMISIKWETIRVDIPVTVDTDAIASENIEKAIATGKDLDKVYYNAASYYFSAKNDNKTALEYVTKSIKQKEVHNSLFLKARIMYANGEKKEAIKTAEKAKKMAIEADSQGWADFIGSTLEGWKK